MNVRAIAVDGYLSGVLAIATSGYIAGGSTPPPTPWIANGGGGPDIDFKYEFKHQRLAREDEEIIAILTAFMCSRR